MKKDYKIWENTSPNKVLLKDTDKVFVCKKIGSGYLLLAHYSTVHTMKKYIYK